METKLAPENCPHCAYDRRFFGYGGWIEQDNNGPIVSCPVCNADGSYLDGLTDYDRAELQRTPKAAG